NNLLIAQNQVSGTESCIAAAYISLSTAPDPAARKVIEDYIAQLNDNLKQQKTVVSQITKQVLDQQSLIAGRSPQAAPLLQPPPPPGLSPVPPSLPPAPPPTTELSLTRRKHQRNEGSAQDVTEHQGEPKAQRPRLDTESDAQEEMAVDQELHASQNFLHHYSRPHSQSKFNFVTILYIFTIMPLSFASTTPLHTLALNANGLGDVMKISAIEHMVRTTSPQALVVGETKSTNRISSRLRLPDYRMYENPGRSSGRRSGKWGVILGIHRSLTVASHLTLPSDLDGRVIALDIVIPTTEHTGFTHRLIGVYAPWDPGENPDCFWQSISELCTSAPHSWSVHGDFNASLTHLESSSASSQPSSPRSSYRTFLTNSHGIDLWSLIPDRHYETHYTYRTFAAGSDQSFRARAIIDRVAASQIGIISGEISTLDNFIPCTDHRPISSRLILSAPDHKASNIPSEIPPTSYNPRFLHPYKTEGHRFHAFSSGLDDLISENPVLSQIEIIDDASFDSVYKLLTELIQQSATNAFRKPKKAPPSSRPSNPTIRLVITELRHVNRLIAAIKAYLNHGVDQFPSQPWVHRYYNAFLSSPNALADPSFPAYWAFLKSVRRQLHKIRFAEERAATQDKCKVQAERNIKGVLRGGSVKRLFSHQFSSLPLAVLHPDSVDPDPPILTGAENVKSATTRYFTKLYE
ncbi:hypothetical protein H0H92_010320, partial [Tricholoma furcatifolium]